MPKPSSSKKHLGLVINTKSRTGKDSLVQAQKLLEAAGFTVEPFPVTASHSIANSVKKIKERGVTLVVVGGGDGTVSEIVGHLANTNITLGILPLGTANSFTRSLDIPQTLEAAVEVIRGGKTAKVDLGKINDHYFANATSIGFATTVADDISPSLKRSFGIFAYIIQGVKNIPRLKSFRVRIEGSPDIETYQVVIANGGYYGPSLLQSKKHLQTSDLSIFTFKNESLPGLMMIWLRSLFGIKISHQPTQQIVITKQVTLSTTPSQKVSIDGEIKTSTPIRVSVASDALNVLVAEESNLHT